MLNMEGYNCIIIKKTTHDIRELISNLPIFIKITIEGESEVKNIGFKILGFNGKMLDIFLV